ncbi:LLM class flavin-dependent oxidoreductase [Ruania halotolerans]|uniref:LLM class flavin-dependent oxidoreductase n=1 Tax=Ruania halotolerans TaxID=2897773 RepID=UPI001E571AAF|nr:LLM class flavin-dependent oxidoreductase [Ruania halotolerans]UFU07924.1 LLM class flavin-dependent oxidoreductase [Ruania halotolerans]
MTDYGHDLTFGTFLTPQAANPQAPVALAQLTEQVGLDLVTLQDHPYQPSFLDTWTLLTWIAAQTERVTVAGNVLNLPLRPPAVLAKSLASLDLLSGGRAALGLGAGAFWDAIEAMGTPRRTPGEAVDALTEAIEVIRELWDTTNPRPLRIEGEHYRLTGAKRGPAPKNDVPIWLGAYKPRMLRLVAQRADGWLPSLAYLKDGDLARGNATIDAAAEKAGRHPAEIRRLLNINGAVSPTSQGYLNGPVEQWVEELTALALTDGIGTFILGTDDPAFIATFGEEIAPAVRDAVGKERGVRGTTPATAQRGSAALAKRRDGIDYDGLSPALAATAVEPGDRAYAGMQHNYLRAGSPGLILQPQTPVEVAHALAFAREQEVPLGVRSGGHGISGKSTNDGGLVLDLRALASVEVLDSAEGSPLVRAGAGATWAKVAETLTPHGLAISSGDYGGVGVGGLATTGGVGLLGRTFGLTIDRVRAAQVVTADGQILHASPEEHPDLFWGLRGAGGNLGIVTSVDIEPMPLGDVVFSQMSLDATDTAGLLQRWGAVVESAPRELTSFLILSPARRGQPAVAQLMTVVASDDTEMAVRQLERLADAGPLLGHQAYQLPYAQVVRAGDRNHSGGGTPAVRSTLVTHLDGAADAFARVADSGVAYFLQIRATGGASHDLAPDATAYPHRHQNFLLSAMGANQERLDGVWDGEMVGHGEGLYLSFDTADTGARPDLLEAAFGSNLPRLKQLKRDWDPSNVFSGNFPIPPA